MEPKGPTIAAGFIFPESGPQKQLIITKAEKPMGKRVIITMKVPTGVVHGIFKQMKLQDVKGIHHGQMVSGYNTEDGWRYLRTSPEDEPATFIFFQKQGTKSIKTINMIHIDYIQELPNE